MSCEECGGEITSTRKNTRYCSSRCYQRFYRREVRNKGKVTSRGKNTGRSKDVEHVRAVQHAYKIKSNARSRHLMETYGITEDQYEFLLLKQQRRCMICQKHEDESDRRLAVDHNHKTGEIRGLLCNYCNHRVVGRHTDGTLLRKIADYVEQGTGWFVPPKKKRKKRGKVSTIS